MTASILVVDDESTTQETLGAFLETEGYRVATAGSGREALARIEAEAFDVIVADVVMPDLSGLDLLEHSRRLSPEVAVILISGHATVDAAIQALRKGAGDYLQKPFRLNELALTVQRLLRHRTAYQEPRARPPALPPPSIDTALIGASAAMRSVREQIARCAPAPSHVLITGESGAGKEDLRASAPPESASVNLRRAVRAFTRQHILDVLGRVRHDKRAAARLLGISLASLYRKLNVEPRDGSSDAPDDGA